MLGPLGFLIAALTELGLRASLLPTQTRSLKGASHVLLDANLPAVRAEAPTQFRTLTVVAVVLLALTVLWGFVDARLIEGVPVWMKPLKFALSFVVLFGTIALVEPRLSERLRDGWTCGSWAG
jgi:hypothetical protein